MLGLVGKKIGMTQVVNPAGHLWPVTIVEVEPATIMQVRTKAKNGYDAIQLASTEIREKHLNKAQKGFFEKAKVKPKRILKEFRPGSTEDLKELSVGQEMKIDYFEEGDFVDVHGRSIGKGFQGVIKRWNMSRGPETHGSMSHREIGSIGCSADPSRTWKGQKMPGRMGYKIRTVQNLLVVKVLKEDNLLLVKGAIPGSKNTMVTVTKSFKKNKINIEEKYTPTQSTTAGKEFKKTAKKK